MTNIYIMIFLPISLAYMEKKRETEGKVNLYPIALIIFVYFITNVFGDGGGMKWEMFKFNISKIFK